MTRPARRDTGTAVVALGAAGLLLVLLTWTASIGPGRVLSLDGSHRSGSGTSASGPGTTPGRSVLDEVQNGIGGAPGGVGLVVLAVVLPVFVTVLVIVARWIRLPRILRLRLRRRRQRWDEPAVEPPGSAERVRELLSERAGEERAMLAVEGEPRNAIVASWHHLEQNGVRAGVERRPWQTTSEFVLEVLRLVGADPGAVTRFADLYREARFSDHPMTETHRRRAVEALDRVHFSVRAGVRAGPS